MCVCVYLLDIWLLNSLFCILVELGWSNFSSRNAVFGFFTPQDRCVSVFFFSHYSFSVLWMTRQEALLFLCLSAVNCLPTALITLKYTDVCPLIQMLLQALSCSTHEKSSFLENCLHLQQMLIWNVFWFLSVYFFLIKLPLFLKNLGHSMIQPM